MDILIKEAVDIIKKSEFTFAFTGAGISVESGIPPFRGDNGLWNKYDPEILDLNFYYSNTSITAIYTADMSKIKELLPAEVKNLVKYFSFSFTWFL